MPKKVKQDHSSGAQSAAVHSDSSVRPDRMVTPAPRNRKPFFLAIISCALLWLAFPPIGIWPLAWFALVPLIYLILDKQLVGRRPYFQLHFAALLYWLGTLYFVPIPHPMLWFGWFALSLVMAFYTPVFVAIARVMIHQYRIPAMLAVPVAYTGIEWIRCVFLTGFGIACLSHTQYQQAVIIQVADLFGAYTLTFAIVLFSTCVSQIIFNLRRVDKRIEWRTSVVATSVVLAVFGYGFYQLSNSVAGPSATRVEVALIQGSIDTEFPATRQQAREIEKRRREQYIGLTERARKNWPDLDLIVWPESCFVAYDDRNDFVVYDLPPDTNPDSLREGTVDYVRQATAFYWKTCIGYPETFDQPVPLLGGGTSYDPVGERVFNTAIMVDKNGLVSDRYYKNHLVMFGEYVPLSKYFEFLQQLPKIGQGLTAGTESVAMDVNGVKFAPSICFETTVPHFVRNQVNRLSMAGTEPDVLINLTNDGWFFGTSCLDLHLACNVFRAVEMRKKNLVCANTGFSAEIDAYGRILQQGPQRATGMLRAYVSPQRMTSLYRTIGDWPVIGFAAISLVLGMIAWFRREKNTS